MGVILIACTPSEDYKTIRKDVLSKHDEVMADSEIAYRYQKQLDSQLLKIDSLKKADNNLDTLKLKAEITALKSQFSKTEEEMELWMRNLDVELGKKSKDEAVTYFKNEKAKILKLDSLYKRDKKNFLDLSKKYNFK